MAKNCPQPWSSLVEGDGGLYLPNCQTNLVIALHAPSLLFWHFINTTDYHLGRYEPSSPISCHAPRLNSTSLRLLRWRLLLKTHLKNNLKIFLKYQNQRPKSHVATVASITKLAIFSSGNWHASNCKKPSSSCSCSPIDKHKTTHLLLLELNYNKVVRHNLSLLQKLDLIWL